MVFFPVPTKSIHSLKSKHYQKYKITNDCNANF